MPCSHIEVRLCSYFWWCAYFWGPWVSCVTTDEFSVRVAKITSRIGVSWTHSLPFCFNLFQLNELWPYYQKDVNQINIELYNFCITTKSNSPDILALCETNFGWLNWFWQFLWEGLSSFNLKRSYYSYAWSHSLCEGRTSFYMGLTFRKLCRSLLMFSTGFTSLSALVFPLLITFFIFMHGCWFYFI